MTEIDFNNLRYPDHEAKVTKHISYVPNLFFGANLINKAIKIDGKLSIINNGKEKNAILFLRKYITSIRGSNNFPGICFLYTYTDKPKWHFEAQDCIRRFLTAVRIYKETRCDVEIDFSIEDSARKKYYCPFNFSNFSNGIYFNRERSRIESRQELNKIKKIYHKLGEAKFSETIYYSKLYNAVKFFNHSYDEHWTLLKTTLIFIALESLFSDSGKSEVSYKVALRASYFLYPRDVTSRKEIFNIIRRGYDIRSNFVHGSDTEKPVNKIMKKIENEKKAEYYGFHHHFIFDLSKVVSQSLIKILLEKTYFDFFSKEKHSQEEESSFFDDLVIGK